MTTRVAAYIDGFNLYYAIRGTPYRWLNVESMVRTMLRNDDDLIATKYFTARVRGTPRDPDAPIRQQVYLRALATLPDLHVFFGRFLVASRWMPVSHPPPDFTEVIKTEEKGSDVALASHLVADAFLDRFDLAVVASNDSDLAPPIELVRGLTGKAVGVINPFPGKPAIDLQRHASFWKPIRAGVLARSQFPATLRDASGQFTRPVGWEQARQTP